MEQKTALKLLENKILLFGQSMDLYSLKQPIYFYNAYSILQKFQHQSTDGQ